MHGRIIKLGLGSGIIILLWMVLVLDVRVFRRKQHGRVEVGREKVVFVLREHRRVEKVHRGILRGEHRRVN